jgi:hypothetical protein
MLKIEAKLFDIPGTRYLVIRDAIYDTLTCLWELVEKRWLEGQQF